MVQMLGMWSRCVHLGCALSDDEVIEDDETIAGDSSFAEAYNQSWDAPSGFAEAYNQSWEIFQVLQGNKS